MRSGPTVVMASPCASPDMDLCDMKGCRSMSYCIERSQWVQIDVERRDLDDCG
ncbi:hypothetical protein L484_013429 [Morus notabilis]|uniref:Uncharacterized protein n=1 Tax=Morus notabilis TaxID=981085 RepID=W9RAH9_9ROSA|nr:hypothetical protein L484_013429 [Morus notabilis]